MIKTSYGLNFRSRATVFRSHKSFQKASEQARTTSVAGSGTSGHKSWSTQFSNFWIKIIEHYLGQRLFPEDHRRVDDNREMVKWFASNPSILESLVTYDVS